MTKQVHTILCWILALSLVWLPFSVSAEITLSSTVRTTCHEMNSTTTDYDMSIHSMHSAMSVQTVAIDNSMHESMMQKGCCDNDCIACAGSAPCGHSSNHVSVVILLDQYSSQPHPRIQFPIEQFVQYHNQIITPDIHPPIV